MELEADLYAVELTGNSGSFVNALERISYFSGRPRTSGSWRHFSIAKRTGFVLALDADPARRRRFRTVMSILRWSIVAFTLCAAAAAVAAILL
jgi:Zn-dependent protease with chaperone function